MELKRLTDVELEELLREVEAAGFHRQISAYAELQEYRKAEALKQANPPYLFVCGVIDEDGDCRRVSDEEAQFFTIYRQNADGASYALLDCHSRERAEYLLNELSQVVPQFQTALLDDVLSRLEHEANHITAWHHMDEHSCKVGRRDLLTLVQACRAAILKGGAA